ncbi:MAG: glycosyltransferase family 2 protein [Patescibacteria group bacterium]|nr:glycosyltransferase family 2 protein [Patescibacteria group bacterium]MCL5431754.1 glycosyltransferase family 2 protein [Patescibacteria group bacterium]
MAPNFIVVIDYQTRSKIAYPQTVVIDNSQNNIGFTRAANAGIKKALERGAKKIILLNPDIKFTPKVLKLFNSKFDLAGPVLRFQRQGKTIYDYGGRVNLRLGRATHLEIQRPDYVSGACLLITKPVIDQIGLLDERFFLYYSDTDYGLRVKQAGFSVGVEKNIIVDHPIKEHRFHRSWLKTQAILSDNLRFIWKWTPAVWKPVAVIYWLGLCLKYFL